MKSKSFLVIVVALSTLCLTLPFEALEANPPRWAPAHGYRARTRQVYFPEQNFYYDTHRSVYIYLDNGRWVTNVRLPILYAMINLGNAPKVEMEINSDCPYRYNTRHVEIYRVRNNREYRRYNEDDHDRNQEGEHGDDRGDDRGHDRGHGNKHEHKHDGGDD